MKRRLITIITAAALVVMSCNPSRTSSTDQDSNFRRSTTDTSTTNNIPNPDSTQHR